jgi:hypothetical protein
MIIIREMRTKNELIKNILVSDNSKFQKPIAIIFFRDIKSNF